MKVLITGANGFVGKNLVWELKNQGFSEEDLLCYDIDTDPALLDEYTRICKFVFHLAGVNRPKDNSEFMAGNFGFTTTLLNALIKNENKAPVLITSSIHAAGETPYGLSKRAGEDAIFEYGEKQGVKVLVYRLQNLFGKWCRPNYNSAVATFCYNIAHGLDITINDRATVVPLVYIDDLLDEFTRALAGKETIQGRFCVVETYYEESLGDITDLLYGFKASRQTLDVPNVGDAFAKKLYSTYLSYLEPDDFTYPLNTHQDPRGFFAEAFKSSASGQVSVNVSMPGITKGNHWHHTKIEKFLVVSGEGLIRFRKIDSDEITECKVSGDMLQVVDVPPGYTHSIVNTGTDNMITIIWASELFDPDHPDTYPLEV
ncbi:MAG: capsular polysaccharide biosynthesis protein CapF [Eubacteriales bacterium]